MGTDDIIASARSWLGTPYLHQASVKGAGCDCLGLLRGVWRELHGAEPESPPPYTLDWAEATGQETLYTACSLYLTEIDPAALVPGDVALFRMAAGGPAKHCGIVAGRRLVPPDLETCGPHSHLTLIHARQNRRVVEESFGAFWRQHLAYAFRF